MSSIAPIRAPSGRPVLRWSVALLLLLAGWIEFAAAQVAPPAFSKSFAPSTIGPGSVSVLTFTIDNSGGASPVTDLAFTDILPAAVTISSPASASTSCTDATLSAPDGGGTITFSDARVGTGASCTVSVNVTSATPGTHMNVSGDLTSSAGNSGAASDDLVVVTSVPGFSKAFSTASVALGDRSRLTFTIDNSANASGVSNLDFTDSLPAGMLIASPPDAATSCGTSTIPPTLTAPAGGSVITLDANGVGAFPAVAAGASCTVGVDVVATGVGTLNNVSGELLADFVASGKASASLTVTTGTLGLRKAFTDDPVSAASTVTLEFTIDNRDRSSPATNITFTDDLDAALSGLVATGLPLSNACGAGSTLSGTSVLTLTGGTLAPEGSCTFSVSLQVPGAAADGQYTNTTSAVSGEIGGDGVTGNVASDDLFVVSAPLLTKTFVGDPVGTGNTVTLRFTVTNTSSTSTATDVSFIDELTEGTDAGGLPTGGFLPFPVTVGLPPTPDPPCGAGSTLALVSTGTDRQGLALTGGTLAAGASCSFDVDVTIPAGLAAGTYTNTTGQPSATVGGMSVSGAPASDDVVIVAPPAVLKAFTDDPVQPGGTVTLEFSLSHDAFAPGDATSISLTDDLAALTPALAGLAAQAGQLPQSDVCGTGSSLTGASGNTFLTLAGGSLMAGETCSFSVVLDVPAGAAAGDYTNTTGAIVATVLGASATGNNAKADLRVAGLELTKEFIDDPIVPGGTGLLRFTLQNNHLVDDATGIFFSDSLTSALSGLAALAPLPATPCGPGSSLAGTTTLTLTGGELAAGQMCTFDVTVQVPGAAASGTYNNVTSSVSATMGGSGAIFPGATDALVVSADRLMLEKAFTDDPLAPGATGTLRFTLSNLDPAQAASGVAFSDDLDAALSGLVATGTPVAGCGGTLSTADGGMTVDFSGGSIAAGGACFFDVSVAVPPSVPLGTTATNTTSQVSGTIGGLAVTGDPATDVLRIDALQFSKSFDGPSHPGGTPILTFTIANLDSSNALSGLSFTDDLGAVLTGLVATGLPASDICGAGSSIDGTGFLTFTGGNLGPAGVCSFDVALSVPASATPGDFPNTTSELLVSGIPGAVPASASLHIDPSPVFSKAFSPDPAVAGGVSTLTFIVDNTGSTAAASGLDFTDNLPAGLLVATPANAATSCTGGTLTAAPGGGLISYTGGTVAAGASCTLTVDVTAAAAGDYANTSGDLTSSLGNSGTASDSLRVNALPGFAKVFAPDTILAGGISTLSFTIDNAGSTSAATGLDFTDNLPAGLLVATPANAATTCTGGTLTAAPGSGLISYAGGTVAAGASCTVMADVTAATAGDYANTSGDLTSSLGNSGTASDTLRVNAPPGFAKIFAPDTILAGGISTLSFTIDNAGSTSAATGLDFTDNLPAGLLVATPANAATTCTGGTLTAAPGGGLISYSGGTVAAGASCTLSADVTAAAAGDYANTSGDLTSSLGNSGPASDTLRVNGVPGFSKAFSPDPVVLTRNTTLTFTIDNTGSSVDATGLDFSDPLPSSLLVADPANASASCSGGTLTAVPGTGTLSYAGGTASAGASCTISVDLNTIAAGTYTNTTGDLTSSLGNSGPATAKIKIEHGFVLKEFLGDPVPPGATVALQFILDHIDRDNPASDISFTDDLDAVLAGLVAIDTPKNDICGAGSQISGSSLLSFTGGTLNSGERCTFTVTLQVPAAAPTGTFTNTTSAVAADIGGPQTKSPASDDLVVAEVPVLSKAFSATQVAAGGSVDIDFTITNSSGASAATAIAFTDPLADMLPGMTITPPADGFCGAGSTMALTGADGQTLSMSGGDLAAGASCSFAVNLVIPGATSAGIYVNTTSAITATVGGVPLTGQAATASLEVVAAPMIMKAFTDDPVNPGDPVTLEFTIAHDANASADATGINFTDDLDAALSGLVSTSGTLSDVCGSGSQISGTSNLAFTGGTLAPGTSCTFAVTLQVPADALPGAHTNATSSLSATVDGLAVTEQAAVDDLEIAGLTLSKSFTDDPVVPGAPVTLEFTLTNTSGVFAASSIAFTDDLDAVLTGLAASSLPADGFCGAGSAITGAGVLSVSGASLAAGASCSFGATLQVPAAAPVGEHVNQTSEVTADVGGSAVTVSGASDALLVANPLMISKSFIDDPAVAGGTVTLRFTLANADPFNAATLLAFTDDLDAALPGLRATGLPLSDVCGSGSTLTGTSVLTFGGGSLAPGSACSFDVSLQMPDAVASGTSAVNVTSTLTGEVAGTPHTGPAATDTLLLEQLVFSKAFAGDTAPTQSTTLSFTIRNPDPVHTATDIAFTDDLDAMLAGLIATDTPISDICGTGSALSGSALLSFSGGSLGPGASCSFDVQIAIPDAAAAGTYTNTSSAITSLVNGVTGSSSAASAGLLVNPAPGFAKSFAPSSIDEGGVSTLSFTIDNGGSTLSATALGFSDALPAGLAIAGTPAASGSCGGSIDAVADGDTIGFSGGSVAAGASCTISVDIEAATAGSHVNTSDSLMSSHGDSGAASATLTVNDLLPSATLSKTANPISLNEPGGVFGYSIVVTNTSAVEALTLSALTDDRAGDLDGQGDCVVPQSLAVGASYTCSFSQNLVGAGGISLSNTATATLSDDDGNTIMPGDTATVSLVDLLPGISVLKSASPATLIQPGGPVSFAVTVINTSPEPVTLLGLTDSLAGDLAASCGLPLSLAAAGNAGDRISCSFNFNVSGTAGQTIGNTVTATAEDDEGNAASASASASVTLTATPPEAPPVALPDSYVTSEDTALAVPAPGVLGNDVPGDGGAPQAVLLQPPANGQLELAADGGFRYTPQSDFNGSDGFTYRAVDSAGGQSGTGVVSIQVLPVDDPVSLLPIPDQSLTEGVDFRFDISGFASDVDGGALSFAADLPAGFTIDPVGGVITGRADFAATLASPYTVTVRVSNAQGDTAQAEFLLELLPLGRDLGLLLSAAPQLPAVGEAFEIRVALENRGAGDADGVQVLIEFLGSPDLQPLPDGCSLQTDGASALCAPPQGQLAAGAQTAFVLALIGPRPDDVFARGRVTLQQDDLNPGDNRDSLGVAVSREQRGGPAQILGDGSHDLELADLDGDGDLDLLVGGDAGLRRFLNDGAGGFGAGNAIDDAPVRRLAVADLDGDGDPDVLALLQTGATTTALRSYRNDGAGGFAADQSLALGLALDVVLADLNGDGLPDLASANQSPNRILLNDGSGQLVETAGLGDASSRALAIGDLDGDGDQDLVFANAAGGRWWRNDGSANFGGPVPLAAGDLAHVVLADFNGDGRLDIAFARRGDEEAGVTPANLLLLNRGEGVFGDAPDAELGRIEASWLLAEDLDLDGDIDVLAINTDGAHRLFLNDGAAGFSASEWLLLTDEVVRARSADLDGDGDPDLALSSPATGALLFADNAEGSFGDAIQTLRVSGGSALDWLLLVLIGGPLILLRRQARKSGLLVLICALALSLVSPAADAEDKLEARWRVNLRQAPDLQSRIVAVLEPGMAVEVLAAHGEFRHVRREFDGVKGYVRLRNLREPELAPLAPVLPPALVAEHAPARPVAALEPEPVPPQELEPPAPPVAAPDPQTFEAPVGAAPPARTARWYAGIGGGLGVSRVSRQDLGEALRGTAGRVEVRALDESAPVMSLFFGYRLGGAFALEAAYQHLGRYQSEIELRNARPEAVARALRENHPVGGPAASLSLLARHPLGRWDLEAQLGALRALDTGIDASLDGQRIRVDAPDTSHLAALGASLALSPRWRCGLSLNHLRFNRSLLSASLLLRYQI